MSQQYEVYGAGQDDQSDQPWELRDPAVTDASGQSWRVAVEYSNDGQSKPPTVVVVLDEPHPDRATALAAAQRCAFEFDPPDPFSPQGRQVFRDGPDGFLVIIDGAMSTFHMSVRVVQLVGQG
jgi:hypothetical protein